MVRLIFVIYLLAIFEGALRKWVAPDMGRYIFFIRDPFLLLAYALAAYHGLWPRRSGFFTASLVIMTIGTMLAALQAMVGGVSDLRLILAVYGWRSYFLYMPLAVLVAEVFDGDDLRRLYVLTLLLALPIGVLVAAQFFSSPGAPINVGVAEERELQFAGLSQTSERTRPMGTFSSGAGQIQFVGTAFAIVLALLIAPRNIKKPPVLVITAGLLGVLTCLAFSGSRATIGLCAVTGVFALGLGIVGRGGAMRSKAVMLTLTIGVAALTLYPIVFPEGFAALTERLTTANAAETRGGFKYGILSRALYSFIDFIFLIDVVPALGYGIGYGGNASNILGATVDGVKPALLAETDYSRQMVDLGPAFGIAYIGFRLALVLWMATTVLRATRQSSDPMPMLLLSYVAVTVGTGQITGQGAINFYGWFFAGVMLAACKHAVPPAGQRASAPRVKGVRFERMGARHRARFAVNPIAPPAPSHAGR